MPVLHARLVLIARALATNSHAAHAFEWPGMHHVRDRRARAVLPLGMTDA